MLLSMIILDSYWWLAIPGLLLGVYAQIKLTSAYNYYRGVQSAQGISGAEAAREILDEAGLQDVAVTEVGGHLTDHYDPLKKVLCLSSENYRGTSVAAMGVAAHEAGHALQHQTAYAPLSIRMALAPVTQFATSAVYGIFFLSFIMHLTQLAKIAVGIFAVITLFQLITLPVEFDASRRAKAQLLRLGLIRNDEHHAISKVLSAAAMTYVAALVSASLELVHWMLIARGEDRD
jgi:uncharacterized protein